MRDRTLLKRVAHVGGAVVMVVALIYFGRALLGNLNEVTLDGRLGAILLGGIAAVALYLAGMLMNAVAWSGYVRIMGERLPYCVGARIVLLSQFAKYVPGNFAHHLGRIVLSKGAGSSAVTATESTVIEVGLSILVGTLIALAGTATHVGLVPNLNVGGESSGRLVWVAVIAIVGCLGVIGIALLARQRSGAAVPGLLRQLRGLSVLIGASGFAFTMGGSGLWLMLWSTSGVTPEWPFVMVIFAVAWTLGTVTPGAPGGIGVREAIIVAGLTSVAGAGNGAVVALLFRVVTIVGDGLGFLGGLVLARTQPASCGADPAGLR